MNDLGTGGNIRIFFADRVNLYISHRDQNMIVNLSVMRMNSMLLGILTL